MSNTRREFLQSSAALALGIVGGAAANLAAETQSQTQAAGTPSTVPSEVQVPKMKFGSAEVGRLVLGVNPLYGWAHYNNNFSNAMRDWYTQDKVCEVMHRANAFGINALNYVDAKRAPSDLARFQAEGGKMHLIVQVTAKDDAVALYKDHKPLAMHRQGEVIELVEEQGWDVDFYAGCVYNRTRTEEEWKQILNGQLLEMPREIYLQSDPARMYKVMRQTSKTCFAFKILAAGRIADDSVEKTFRTAFSSIKPNDGVFVGMYPRNKDEVKENAEIVHKILTGA